MRKFDFKHNSEAYEFCNKIIDKLIEIFYITEENVLNLMNELWGKLDFTDEYDFIYHESPIYWAFNIL